MTSFEFLKTSDGVEIPYFVIKPEEKARAVFLLMPALGIRAVFYRKLALALAEAGIATLVLEQRGNGESPYRPGDGSHFGLADYVDHDVPAVLSLIDREYEGVPLYIGGHSLGGHMANLAVARQKGRYAGVIQLACGFPYFRDYKYPVRGFVRAMIALIPLLARLVGYFPGNWFGFGGREYSELMLDWRHWAKHGNYDSPGFEGSEAALAAYKGRVISIAFERDTMASDEAIERSRSVYQSAEVTRTKLGPKEQGDYLGHIDWGKAPAGAAKALADWF